MIVPRSSAEKKTRRREKETGYAADRKSKKKRIKCHSVSRSKRSVAYNKVATRFGRSSSMIMVITMYALYTCDLKTDFYTHY